MCVRQMCRQMGHIWMLCVLGHIHPSSSCRKWQEVTPKREIPSLHRRCTVEHHRENHTQSSVARARRGKQGSGPQGQG